MDTNLILSLVNRKKLLKKDVEGMLYDICDAEHASCNNGCPVYKLNGSEAPNSYNEGCDCFKNGNAMYMFIRQNSK